MTKAERIKLIRENLLFHQKNFKATNKQTHEIRYGGWNDLCGLDKRTWTLVPHLTPDEVFQKMRSNKGLFWIDFAIDQGEVDVKTGEYIFDWQLYRQGMSSWTELAGCYIGVL